MLTKADFHQNLRIISLTCKLGVLPLEVNKRTGELELLANKRRQAVCIASFVLYTIHATYNALRLPYLFFKGIPITHLSLLTHVTTILGMAMMWSLHYGALFRCPGITVACFNQAFETWGLDSAGEFLLPNVQIYQNGQKM